MDVAMAPASVNEPRSTNGSVLPVEIIYHIIHLVGPLELICLQTVSKQFHAITNDPTIWRTMYRNARLPRAPGPFPWQPVRFLQYTLVRSARLAETWTSRPMKVTSSRQLVHELQLQLKSSRDYRWFGGRWLLVLVEEKIVSHDVETGSQQTLWDEGRIACWTTCSIMCAQGHLMYLVLGTGNGDNDDAVKLLEFRADCSSGNLLGPITFHVPARWPGVQPHLHCTSARAPFILISVNSILHLHTAIIFDIRTRIFYGFPAPRTELEGLQSYNQFWFPNSEEIWFTMTHIFVVSGCYLDNGNHESVQLIQAYVVPDFPTIYASGLSELCLSHEAIHHGTYSRFILIQHSTVNSDDGATTLKFIHTSTSESPQLLRFLCIKFFLPKSQTNVILPISLDTHEIFSVEGSQDGQYIRASDDGFVRGFYATTLPGNGADQLTLRRFTIDASGSKCVALIGEHSSPAIGLEFLRAGSKVRWFDGIRGRVYYSKHGEGAEDETDSSRIVTFIAEFE